MRLCVLVASRPSAPGAAHTQSQGPRAPGLPEAQGARSSAHRHTNQSIPLLNGTLPCAPCLQMYVYEGSLEAPDVVKKLRTFAQEGGFEFTVRTASLTKCHACCGGTDLFAINTAAVMDGAGCVPRRDGPTASQRLIIVNWCERTMEGGRCPGGKGAPTAAITPKRASTGGRGLRMPSRLCGVHAYCRMA